ncbi:hypothetical protein D9M71_405830 [compost metagenome]
MAACGKRGVSTTRTPFSMAMRPPTKLLPPSFAPNSTFIRRSWFSRNEKMVGSSRVTPSDITWSPRSRKTSASTPWRCAATSTSASASALAGRPEMVLGSRMPSLKAGFRCAGATKSPHFWSWMMHAWSYWRARAMPSSRATSLRTSRFEVHSSNLSKKWRAYSTVSTVRFSLSLLFFWTTSSSPALRPAMVLAPTRSTRSWLVPRRERTFIQEANFELYMKLASTRPRCSSMWISTSEFAPPQPGRVWVLAAG